MYTTLPAVLVTVLTVLSPIITAFFTHVQMDSTAKKNIAFAVSFVVAAVYVWMTGGIHDLTNVAEIAAAAPIIFTLQQLIFGNLLQRISSTVEAKVGVKPPAPAPAAIGGSVPAPSAVADAAAPAVG
jgi:drug/metabolite transporter (DMT)-like permease